MLKFANQIIDAYDDVSKEMLTKVAAKNPDCYMMTPDERLALKDHDFALSVITKKAAKMNKFPINSADSTWLSSEYFDMTHHKLPHQAVKIAAYQLQKACTKYNLPVNASIVAYAELQKEAVPNTYFEGEGAMKPSMVTIRPDLSKIAEVDKIGDNYTAAQYAMPTPAHVKVASEYFEQQSSKMPLETRHKYAAALQRRAHELGMPVLQGTVVKYASDHYSPMVDAHIRARATLLEGKPDLKSTVEKLGAAKKSLTPSQFAQMLHGFDKQAGLSRYYGAHLTNPFEATFATQPDPYLGYRTKVAGQNVTADDLQRIVNAKYAQIKDYFGPHFADEMRKHPNEVFDSLPRDAKELIVGIAEGTH